MGGDIFNDFLGLGDDESFVQRGNDKQCIAWQEKYRDKGNEDKKMQYS